MADDLDILAGSYKGYPISINGGTIDGGRRIAVKQFPNRDTQSVEDMGMMPRRYSLDLVVNDKPDQDYFEYRNGLIAVLESKGPGVLIHPLYGRVENVVVGTFSLNESFSSFGDSTITVNFEPDNNTGIPVTSGAVSTEIEESNLTLLDVIQFDLAVRFGIDLSFIDNFQAAADKVNGLIDKAKDATSFIGDIADTVNEFTATITDMAANVTSLISDPLKLADSIMGMFEGVGGLYSAARSTFDTFAGFFGFGDDDDDSNGGNGIGGGGKYTVITSTGPVVTAGQVQRRQNDLVINGAVAAASLGYAYVAATKIPYTTVAEIAKVTEILDVQYDAVMTSESSQDVKDAVTEMRVKVLAAFDKITASPADFSGGAQVNPAQIITVDTHKTSARLLAFAYYGNDFHGQAIAELNQFDDVSFIEGSVEILTA